MGRQGPGRSAGPASKALQNLPPNQQFVEIAKLAGFQEWAAARGVPQAKTSQCLADQAEVDQLVQMTSDATTQYPEFPGTPTFIINGKLVDQTATWDAAEAEDQARRSAAKLGERGRQRCGSGGSSSAASRASSSRPSCGSSPG